MMSHRQAQRRDDSITLGLLLPMATVLVTSSKCEEPSLKVASVFGVFTQGQGRITAV